VSTNLGEVQFIVLMIGISISLIKFRMDHGYEYFFDNMFTDAVLPGAIISGSIWLVLWIILKFFEVKA